MDSPAARAMLVAIALQESRIETRRQIGGPARGFWQFEQAGGVRGVLTHPLTAQLAAEVCDERSVKPTSPAVYARLEKDDVLAAAFARLLLYPTKAALPLRGEYERSWRYYIEAWRPGKPHRDGVLSDPNDDWDDFYDTGWSLQT